jgi:hypothetical protein
MHELLDVHCDLAVRGVRLITFEVRPDRRQDDPPAGRMISTTWKRAGWIAVGPRLDPVVRRRHLSNRGR